MDSRSIKRNLPTFYGLLERRPKTKQQLPKHLQPRAIWPAWVQIALNLALITTNLTLMWNKDEYLTDVGPAIPMTVSLLFLFYAVVSAAQVRAHFPKGRGARLAKVNLGLTVLSFFTWAATIAVFLP